MAFRSQIWLIVNRNVL